MLAPGITFGFNRSGGKGEKQPFKFAKNNEDFEQDDFAEAKEFAMHSTFKQKGSSSSSSSSSSDDEFDMDGEARNLDVKEIQRKKEPEVAGGGVMEIPKGKKGMKLKDRAFRAQLNLDAGKLDQQHEEEKK